MIGRSGKLEVTGISDTLPFDIFASKDLKCLAVRGQNHIELDLLGLAFLNLQ